MKKAPSMLRAAREREGLTIRELHQATGISTGRLSMLERSMVKPSSSEQAALAAVLHVPAGDLEALFVARSPALERGVSYLAARAAGAPA